MYLIEIGTIERLSEAHVQGAIARDLVVLVEEVVVLDIVEQCGSGGIHCNHGHIELFRGMLEERIGGRKWVCDLES